MEGSTKEYGAAAEVEQAERVIQSKTAEWMMQMNQVREAFDSYIICMETKAEGDTAEAVNNYMADIHKYLLNQFYSLFTEMNSRIIAYGEGFMQSGPAGKQPFGTAHRHEEIPYNDFYVMEKMMDNLESLIEEYAGKSVVEVLYYQKGSIRRHGEVWELERLAKERTKRLGKDRETLQRAMKAYRNRLLQF